METSTPVRTGDSLRRRTLLKIVDAPIPTNTVNDESERSSRRSFIEMQKKMTPQPVAQSPALNDSVRFSGEQEIKDHFQICTKLHAENKITARVAWQLHIIDLLRVVSRKESKDTLQVASTSLDIGAKVYSLRVDDIHAEGLKLASSMARFVQKNAQDDENENNVDENGDPAGDEVVPSKRKKRKLQFAGGPKNTIAKDPKNLLAPIQKLESVFFSTRIDSNLSTVENLFTNRLPMDKSCYKFMILNKEDKAWPKGPDEAVRGLEESREFNTDLLPKSGHICKPFQNFILDKWDPDEEELNADKTGLQQKDDVVVYDDQGLPVPELDGSIHDPFIDNNDAMEDEIEHEEEFVMQQMQHDIAHVVDLIRPEDDFRRSEYSYNSVISVGNGKVIDQIWAGPSHWKLKFLRRSKSRFLGNANSLSEPKTKKKKTTTDPQPVTFDDLEDDKLVEMLDNMKRIKNKKKINPANKITLPLPDSSCINLLNDVYELMIKPGTVPVSKSDLTGVNTTENMTADNQFGIDNPETEMDGGMDNMDHVDHDQGDDEFMEEEVAMNQLQNFMRDNLVDAPEYVPKAYVPYALQAKKMDMKKLKTNIWELLTQSSLESSKNVIPTTFSKLFSDLPSILPEAMKKELSCPLAFAALLHLCNDRTLKLTQFPNYKDFKIESG